VRGDELAIKVEALSGEPAGLLCGRGHVTLQPKGLKIGRVRAGRQGGQWYAEGPAEHGQMIQGDGSSSLLKHGNGAL
jgi:hypothetical protein